MKKRFNIKFILIIISVFFFINVDVKAIDFTCKYKNGNDTLSLKMSGEYGSGGEYQVSYNIVINDKTEFKFYPANYIMLSNNIYERHYAGGYLSGKVYDYACPKTLDTVWNSNAFLYKDVRLSYNNINGTYEEPRMPLIFFSEQGYKIENNKLTNTILYLDEPLVPGLLKSEYGIKTFNIDKNNSSSEIIDTPPPATETGNLQYCYYKNDCGAVIELKFYKNANFNERIFNDGKKLMNWENYDTCPISIRNQNSKYYGYSSSCSGTGSVKDCYNFLESSEEQKQITNSGNCSDVSDNPNEKLTTSYVAYNHPNAPTIKITNMGDGTISAAIKSGVKDKKITIQNMSSYKNAFSSGKTSNYPKYLIANGDNYQFSNDKKSATSSSIVYINVAHINSIVGLGEKKTIESCNDLLGNTFVNFLNNNVIKVIYIGIPILLILLTSFDFAKVVFIDDKEGIQGAAKKFGKRAIIAVLIFLIPSILTFVINIFVADEVNKCVEVFKNVSESSD